MSRIRRTFRRLRGWIPLPTHGLDTAPVRWVLLEGNRLAVAGSLLTLTFLSILGFGSVWTFEMQRLLTETNSVQTVLNTLLGGIILLVSVVVSINSIVLTYDITSLESQQERVEARTEFRRRVGHVVNTDSRPTDPAAFLEHMAAVIRDLSESLEDVSGTDDTELAGDVDEFSASVETSIRSLEAVLDDVEGADFGVLWLGLEADLGTYVDELQAFDISNRQSLDADDEEKLDALPEAFELFETGREFFKTLYYTQEIARLSQTLLLISLPAVIVTVWTILAIDANTIPRVWLFGLPPLQVFLAAAFTISLAPYVTLTAFVARTATVARRTATGGPFVLE